MYIYGESYDIISKTHFTHRLLTLAKLLTDSLIIAVHTSCVYKFTSSTMTFSSTYHLYDDFNTYLEQDKSLNITCTMTCLTSSSNY